MSFPYHALHRLLSTSKPWSPSNHSGRPSRNGFQMTSQISIGSTRNASQQAPSPKAMTKLLLRSLSKFLSLTGASWFWTTPESKRSTGQPINRSRKGSWQCGVGWYAPLARKLAQIPMKPARTALSSHRFYVAWQFTTQNSPFAFSFTPLFPPQPPFSPMHDASPQRRGLSAKSKFLL